VVKQPLGSNEIIRLRMPSFSKTWKIENAPWKEMKIGWIHKVNPGVKLFKWPSLKIALENEKIDNPLPGKGMVKPVPNLEPPEWNPTLIGLINLNLSLNWEPIPFDQK